MVKSFKFMFYLLGICNILYISMVVLYGFNDYLYAKFTFDSAAFFFNFAAMLIADGIIIGAFFLLRKSSLMRLIPIMICIFIIVAYVFFAMPFALTAGAFWESKTEIFEEFNAVDSNLDENLKFADLTLGQIIELIEVPQGEFSYSYQSLIFGMNFSFKGNFKFSEENYQYLKDKLLSAEEWEFNASGYFVFNDDMTESEYPYPAIDLQNSEIIFNDSENSFFFNLVGTIDT